jgi:antitoxin component YwqK of YwqJK toxin-antitoxin module
MSNLECIAITKAGTRCKRNAEYDSKYCWQHDNYLNDLAMEVIQYTLNGYLDYVEDIPKLEELTEIKFAKEPHIYVEELYDKKTKQIMERNTYLDEDLIKEEFWYESGQKAYEHNWWKGESNGKSLEWDSDGDLIGEHDYKNGITEGKVWIKYTDENVIIDENYKNGMQEGKQYKYDIDTKFPWYEQNYKNGKKDGIQYHWEIIDEKSYYIIIENYKDGKIVKSESYISNGPSNKDISKSIKISENNYTNGYTDGDQYEWDNNGNLEKIETYNDGYLVEEKIYSSTQQSKNDELTEIRKYKDDKLTEIERYEGGYLVGTIKPKNN